MPVKHHIKMNMLYGIVIFIMLTFGDKIPLCLKSTDRSIYQMSSACSTILNIPLDYYSKGT